jgi:hypothetical protein
MVQRKYLRDVTYQQQYIVYVFFLPLSAIDSRRFCDENIMYATTSRPHAHFNLSVTFTHQLQRKMVKIFCFPTAALPSFGTIFFDEVIFMINLVVPFLGNLEQQGAIHNALTLCSRTGRINHHSSRN